MDARRTILAAGSAAGLLATAVGCGSSSGGVGGATPLPPAVTVTTQVQAPAPTVTVTQTATGAAASPAATPPPPGAPAPRSPATPAPASPERPRLTNAAAVVEQYYQDITNRDYAAAWALGGSNIAGRSYGQYVAGFSTTASISLGTVSEFGASQVQAVLYATQTDGTVKVYEGTYTVSGGVLVGASIRQVG